MSTVEEHGDLAPLGVPLPLATIAVAGGDVIEADDRARQWAPASGWLGPLVKWFASEDPITHRGERFEVALSIAKVHGPGRTTLRRAG